MFKQIREFFVNYSHYNKHNVCTDCIKQVSLNYKYKYVEVYN